METPDAPKPQKRPLWLAIVVSISFLVSWLFLNAGFPVLWGAPLMILVVPILVTICLFLSQRRAFHWIVGTLSLGIIGLFLLQELPIYSLDFGNCNRIEILYWGPDGKELKIDITSPNELDAFKEYGKCGHYTQMIKCGRSRRLRISQDGTCTTRFAHGNSIGPSPGGSCQSVFIPSKPGFRDFLSALMKKHGYDEDKPTATPLPLP